MDGLCLVPINQISVAGTRAQCVCLPTAFLLRRAALTDAKYGAQVG